MIHGMNQRLGVGCICAGWCACWRPCLAVRRDSGLWWRCEGETPPGPINLTWAHASTPGASVGDRGDGMPAVQADPEERSGC